MASELKQTIEGDDEIKEQIDREVKAEMGVKVENVKLQRPSVLKSKMLFLNNKEMLKEIPMYILS